ncbi:16S rRNA (adenine(1518)-N(6)/adenine(1519)-N(6))-dimethyltransferase RsmA [Blattabacterium cuenoti]|uniref:16S rRNA (adenine(1518)-N(6)/adenine(1519)-N(6))- dimethyltransferase RsmA n=1 Tax=Blattabacterium cuenoti TaxID=1653831 RepID=UPI00163CB115|nr:16S rRNA (adenine(1518)-N(6)/adenine(1519)-N(6))-dimethyltransferase RsmA [Blattabacterium cuenoti]
MHKLFFKKKFDQYFLKDQNIAKKIVNHLSFENYNTVVEVGPGLGILTQYLLINPYHHVFFIEIDKQLISFLKKKFLISNNKIIHNDFLKWNPEEIKLHNFAIIGNFPYKISSQILFHILKYNQYIPECIGMFQKEVAKRITSHKGKKTYGILSVLIQTFYDAKYLFTVKKKVFFPVPNVESAVISLKRKNETIYCDKNVLFKCVKTAFNQRRKKLKNSLQLFKYVPNFNKIPFLNKRAEELSVKEFIQLTREIEIKLGNDYSIIERKFVSQRNKK